DEGEEVDEETAETVESDGQRQESEEERGRGRRRRKRRRRRDEEPVASASASPIEVAEDGKNAASRFGAGNGRAEGDHSVGDDESDAERRRRRRRGGRRRARRDGVSEPSFEEPHPSPDLVAILPTPGVEEQEPAAVEAIASAPAEARDAMIERVRPPEFASETYDRSESTQTDRAIEMAAPERVAATDEIRAEVSGGTRGESPGSASSYP